MWGDLVLLKYYPQNWQASLYRSGHTWILHTSIWHYWLLFTFIIAMNLFIIYVYKTISYQRSDIKGTKSVGDKRRVAWPEILVVLLPIYWALNIVTNALAYLRAVEGSCGHILVSVQVNGFQWGWKYCYNDTFYTKLLTNPILVGYNNIFLFGGPSKFGKADEDYLVNNEIKYAEYNFQYKLINLDYWWWDYYLIHRKKANANGYYLPDMEKFEEDTWRYNSNNSEDFNLTAEHYFCRRWLKKLGKLENEFDLKVLNKKFQHGYWVISQGLNPDSGLILEKLNKNTNEIEYNYVKDPLRLLRSSGALVLPTRSNIRLMGCSDDITHSWAVPALGIKMDCVPGRLFFFYTNIIREGIYFGQCSELCGWNHYNMPIVLYALPIEHFITWWEIELHALFNKKVKNNDTTNKHYKLINYKYK